MPIMVESCSINATYYMYFSVAWQSQCWTHLLCTWEILTIHDLDSVFIWKYLPGDPLSPFMPEGPACPWCPGGPRSPAGPRYPAGPMGPAGSWGPTRPSLPSLPCCCSSNLTSPQRVELMVVCSVGADVDSALLSDLRMAVAVGGKVLLDLCKSADETSSLQNMPLSMYRLHGLHLDTSVKTD